MKKFWPAVKFVFPVYFFWRVSLMLFGLFSFRLFSFKASFPYIDQALIVSAFPQWVWHWGNFDGVHYLSLAKFGYREGDQVFFPLFPLAINILGNLLGNHFLAGFLISNLAIFFAAVVFYLLIVRDFNHSVARWAIIFLFLFPTSFFFGAIYTESLFLLLILCAYYFKSFIFSFLAGLTRLVGFFVLPAGILGVFSYIFYLWKNFNNPFYFISAQAAFQNQRAFSLSGIITPPQAVWRYFKIFHTVSFSHPDFWVAALELTAFLFGLIILTWLTLKKKLPFKYLIFSWPAFLLPAFSGTFSSFPRYLLTIFPIFIGLAQIKSLAIKLLLLLIFVCFLPLLTMLWLRGYWIS